MNIDETLEIIEEVVSEQNEPAESEVDIEKIEATERPVDEVAEENCELPDLNEIANMRSELDRLRSELIEKRSHLEKMDKEYAEFSELYPDVRISSLPDSVWQSVNSGIPLAAAYALYERKNALRADTASRINERNGSTTTGPVGRASTENFYTPDEVRKMSRAEVKQNYSKILESMKKWN